MRDLILDDENVLCLKYQSGTGFRNFFRISSSKFETILNQKIVRQDNSFRMAIPAHERLAVTLRCLVTGDTIHFHTS